MSHCRDRVEDLMVARLGSRSDSDQHVPDASFNAVMDGLRPVLGRVLREVHVPSFTNEDLLSFAAMKVHQMMRRGQLDADNYRGQAYRALRNLFADLVRRQDAAWRAGLESDPIDHTRGSYDWKRAPTVTVSYEAIAEFYASESG